ncbi:MAG: type II secretion system protein GspL [Pseudomonadota bacterium]
MPLLQVFLPNGWPTRDSTDTAPLRWRLTEGITTRSGESTLEKLPRGADIELIVPASQVLFAQVKLPPGNTQRMSEMASFAVEDKLLGDPETIHAAVGIRGLDGMATAAIVDRAWLHAVRDHFSAAGLRLIRAISEIATVPFTPGAWDLVWHGTQGWLRTIEDQGLVVDLSGDNVPLSLLLALKEAQAANTLPDRIIVHAAENHALPDLTRWQQELQLPVEAGTPWSWQRIDVSRRGINLLQGPFAPSRSNAELLTRFRVPLSLAAGIVGLYFILSTADWAWLTWQKRALQTEMTQTFKTAFPDSNTIANAPLQMQRKVMELKRINGEAQPSDFLPLLASALPAMNATGGTPQAVQYDHGKLRLDLQLSQVQSLDALTQQLSAAGIQARVESINPTANGAVARITFTGGTI